MTKKHTIPAGVGNLDKRIDELLERKKNQKQALVKLLNFIREKSGIDNENIKSQNI